MIIMSVMTLIITFAYYFNTCVLSPCDVSDIALSAGYTAVNTVAKSLLSWIQGEHGRKHISDVSHRSGSVRGCNFIQDGQGSSKRCGDIRDLRRTFQNEQV